MTANSDSDEGPHFVDVHVGMRIRRLRKQRVVTQQQLARRIGVTFQQVQKYERGSNRVSASKLWQICQVLDCQISTIYDGLMGTNQDASLSDIQVEVASLMGGPYGADVARYFPQLKVERQKLLAQLMKSLIEA